MKRKNFKLLQKKFTEENKKLKILYTHNIIQNVEQFQSIL